MNILKISDIYELEVAKFIHSYNQKRFPENTRPLNQLINSIIIKQNLSQMRTISYKAAQY